ncbi:hypothetical protein HY338_02655 [Candidatus Gottesmanbacteria bacterium]|nr:hypothetical protein [Candidatus Gottesmanbacteria bacterium]
MAKGTIFLIFFLSIVAVFLVGINLGKKIGITQSKISTNLSPTSMITLPLSPSPTVILSPTIVSTISSALTPISSAKVIFTDKTCGVSFSYPGNFIRQQTTNEKSIIFTNPDDDKISIAVACAEKIPVPPVKAEKIESIIVDSQPATLYHDINSDNSPRDEVIVKHPYRSEEVIVAGYGTTFQNALSSFKFIQ